MKTWGVLGPFLIGKLSSRVCVYSYTFSKCSFKFYEYTQEELGIDPLIYFQSFEAVAMGQGCQVCGIPVKWYSFCSICASLDFFSFNVIIYCSILNINPYFKWKKEKSVTVGLMMWLFERWDLSRSSIHRYINTWKLLGSITKYGNYYN